MKTFDCSDPYFKALSAELQARKNVPSLIVIKILTEFNKTKDLNTLENCTFKYIHNFMETGYKEPRLKIACEDFGYKISELESLKCDGKDSDHIIEEILSRSEETAPTAETASTAEITSTTETASTVETAPTVVSAETTPSHTFESGTTVTSMLEAFNNIWENGGTLTPRGGTDSSGSTMWTATVNTKK